MKHFYLFTKETVTVTLGALTLRSVDNKTVANATHAIAAAPHAGGYLIVASSTDSVKPTHNGSHDGWMNIADVPATVLKTEVDALIDAAVTRANEECEQKQGPAIDAVLSIAHQSHVQRDKVINHLVSQLIKS